MLKFLSIATLVAAGLALSAGDAGAFFHHKKKKKGCCPAPVAAPCCGGGAGYQAGNYPGGPYSAVLPPSDMTPGFAMAETVPTPMPSDAAVIVPATYVAPAAVPYPANIPVGPAIYTEPASSSSSKRWFRR